VKPQLAKFLSHSSALFAAACGPDRGTCSTPVARLRSRWKVKKHLLREREILKYCNFIFMSFLLYLIFHSLCLKVLAKHCRKQTYLATKRP